MNHSVQTIKIIIQKIDGEGVFKCYGFQDIKMEINNSDCFALNLLSSTI